jgi:recombination protein RecA
MSAKDAVLKDALKNIEKQFGKGAVMRMGDNSTYGQINTFHTGSYVMDMIL